jgi:hypothetical protein
MSRPRGVRFHRARRMDNLDDDRRPRTKVHLVPVSQLPRNDPETGFLRMLLPSTVPCSGRLPAAPIAVPDELRPPVATEVLVVMPDQGGPKNVSWLPARLQCRSLAQSKSTRRPRLATTNCVNSSLGKRRFLPRSQSRPRPRQSIGPGMLRQHASDHGRSRGKRRPAASPLWRPLVYW